jgi:hypothetical protein
MVQILLQSYFELVSLVIALKATELVLEPVTQMAVEPIKASAKAKKFQTSLGINV